MRPLPRTRMRDGRHERRGNRECRSGSRGGRRNNRRCDGPDSIVVSGESGTVQAVGGAGAEDAVQPGPVEGNFVVTYEDEYGEEYEMKVPVETVLTPMPDYGGMDPGEELPPEEPAGFRGGAGGSPQALRQPWPL